MVDASSFPTVGFISVDSEIIHYTGKSTNTLTGCARGSDGTSAATHDNAAIVKLNVIAIHHNRLKDALIAVQTALGAGLVNIVKMIGDQTETLPITYTVESTDKGGEFYVSVYGF